jgi:hypothetical protein
VLGGPASGSAVLSSSRGILIDLIKASRIQVELRACCQILPFELFTGSPICGTNPALIGPIWYGSGVFYVRRSAFGPYWRTRVYDRSKSCSAAPAALCPAPSGP